MAWHKTSRHERGLGSNWDKARKRALERDKGLCQVCAKAGRVTLATEVDHINPRAKKGDHSLDNLQSICNQCHKRKTAEESGKTYRPTIGPDGWPIEE